MEDYLQHRVIDNDNPPPPSAPIELSEDYLEAQKRADDYLRMFEEGVTIFDKLYWVLLFSDIRDFIQIWGHWLEGKLLIVGVGFFASIAAGSIFMAFLGTILSVKGPIRIKNLGILSIIFIIGSVFVTNSIEVASATILGTGLLLYFFFMRISTGCALRRGKMVSVKTVPPTFLAVEFWYAGKRTLWIDFEHGCIGIY